MANETLLLLANEVRNKTLKLPHDEANHQGEIYLLKKMLNRRGK